ncbi:glutathione S-transferase family protein [Alsobacter sp. SYSU M60028]|uniref:Glutathione S-transferase family protein n=1 Tax=Alsobacter ponti TaxID=2962936 RepID=A0ABT1L938_9HYPH|nr:glutathione S-transferase family protein [Alsobacter ponti]MCP8937601.1 glutathione S-transferase family protein [Alsobacter ponti]
MTPILYAHPFSSYCQKALIGLYEYGAPFDYRMLSSEHPENGAELARLWPLLRFPVLVDAGRTIMEASIVIEHVGLSHPDAIRLVPSDPGEAIEVRMLDRVFDNYVMTPMQTVVFDALRPPEHRDGYGVTKARELLDRTYAWLDQRLAGGGWAAGAFSLADCAAAPSLFFADWVHPIPPERAALRAYRARLLARPSVARAVDEARPYRHLFPLGDPGRD